MVIFNKMKITAVIAEFNPFHKGHKYIIDKAREETEADIILVLMSGNFVQRGEPAIFDMGVRAETALKNGADFIFELPPFIALSSAEGFASGGVALLNKLGADSMVFGSECADISALSATACILSEESPGFKNVLQKHLRSGDPFPAAREAAVKACIHDNYSLNSANLREILHEPNNILALEYLKALKKTGSMITPHTVRRINSSYHDEAQMTAFPAHSSEGRNPGSLYCAESLRNLIFSKNIDPFDSFSGLPSEAFLKSIINAMEYKGAVHRDSLTAILLYKLLSDDLLACLEKAAVPHDLIKRIINNRNFSGTFSEFCSLLKTRNITFTAVSRHLLHMILNMDYASLPLLRMINNTDYIRLLGFSRSAEGFFPELRKRSGLMILSNSSDIKAYFKEQPSAAARLKTHLRIDQTHAILKYDSSGNRDCQQKRKQHPLLPEISRRLIIS